jgi:DNA-binding MarR family transcriptional regulator
MTDNPLILKDFFPYLLTNLAQRVSSSLAKTYRDEFNLTIPEWRVLASLGERGTATAKMIAAESFMDKVKTSRAIKELTAKGVLKKKQDATDSRAYWLSLNRKGLRLYNNVVPYARLCEKELLSSLSAAEYRQLRMVFDKLSQHLENMGQIDPKKL